MPYGRRPRVSRRRPRRAYSKRNTKSNRLYKSTKAKSNFKSVGLPKELTVKAPIHQIYNMAPAPGGGAPRFVILGSSMNPLPAVLRGSVGTPVSAVTTTLGDYLYPVQTEYSQLYGTSQIMWSGWNIQFTNTDADTIISVVICVVPYVQTLDESVSPLVTGINTLDAMNFDSVCSQPYAKTYQLGIAGASSSTRTLSIKRSTKSMLRVSNLRDVPAETSQKIPFVEDQNISAPTGWFVYVRSNGIGVTARIKGMAYIRLSERVPQAIDTPVPIPPPPTV